MITNHELDMIADEHCITVMNVSCPASGSISIMSDNGSCYIAIDNNTTSNEQLVRKAHELGHCITGSFYNRYSRLDIISRHEYRADRWAIKKLVPEDELEQCFKQGITEIWELAEYFGIPEEFMIKACKLYGFLS